MGDVHVYRNVETKLVSISLVIKGKIVKEMRLTDQEAMELYSGLKRMIGI